MKAYKYAINSILRNKKSGLVIPDRLFNNECLLKFKCNINIGHTNYPIFQYVFIVY